MLRPLGSSRKTFKKKYWWGKLTFPTTLGPLGKIIRGIKELIPPACFFTQRDAVKFNEYSELDGKTKINLSLLLYQLKSIFFRQILITWLWFSASVGDVLVLHNPAPQLTFRMNCLFKGKSASLKIHHFLWSLFGTGVEMEICTSHLTAKIVTFLNVTFMYDSHCIP